MILSENWTNCCLCYRRIRTRNKNCRTEKPYFAFLVRSDWWVREDAFNIVHLLFQSTLQIPSWLAESPGSAFSSRVLSSTYYQNQSLKKISSSTDIWVSDLTLAILRLSCCSEHKLHLINPITFLSTSHTPSCINKTDLHGPIGFCLKMDPTSGHFWHEFLLQNSFLLNLLQLYFL